MLATIPKSLGSQRLEGFQKADYVSGMKPWLDTWHKHESEVLATILKSLGSQRLKGFQKADYVSGMKPWLDTWQTSRSFLKPFTMILTRMWHLRPLWLSPSTDQKLSFDA